jgi:hypothetical protein
MCASIYNMRERTLWNEGIYEQAAPMACGPLDEK